MKLHGQQCRRSGLRSASRGGMSLVARVAHHARTSLPCARVGAAAIRSAAGGRGRLAVVARGTAVQTTPRPGTDKIKRLGAPSSGVFVAGAEGAVGIRILSELLEAGFKVTAGVRDEAEARATLAFMQRYELLSRAAAGNLTIQEVDLEDEEAVRKLTRRCKFLIVDGDIPGGPSGPQRPDSRALSAGLAAARACAASQVVVVSLVPASGGGGGGGLFRGSSSLPNPRPTRQEQQALDSDLPSVLVVRGLGIDPAATVAAEASAAVAARRGGSSSGLRVAPLGSLAPSLPTSKQQLASVVAAALRQPSAQGSLLIEAGAVAGAAEELDVDAAVAGAIAEASRQAAATAAASRTSVGTLSIKRQQEEETEEEEEDGAGPRGGRSGGLLSGLFGGRKAEATVETPSPVARAGSGGRRAAAVPAAPAAARGGVAARRGAKGRDEDEEEEEEEEEEEQKGGGGLFGLLSGTAKIRQQQQQEKEKEKEQGGSAKVRVGSGGSGKVKVGGSGEVAAVVARAAAKAAAASAADKAAAERAAAAKAAVERATAAKAAAAKAAAERAAAAAKASAARRAASPAPSRGSRKVKVEEEEEDEEEEEAKGVAQRGGGFMGFLFGAPARRGRAEEEDEEEEEDEVVVRQPVRGTGKVQVAARKAAPAPPAPVAGKGPVSFPTKGPVSFPTKK